MAAVPWSWASVAPKSLAHQVTLVSVPEVLLMDFIYTLGSQASQQKQKQININQPSKTFISFQSQRFLVSTLKNQFLIPQKTYVLPVKQPLLDSGLHITGARRGGGPAIDSTTSCSPGEHDNTLEDVAIIFLKWMVPFGWWQTLDP